MTPRKPALVGVPEMGAFDATNEWSVWRFQLVVGEDPLTQITWGCFVLAKLWMDARPLAEMFLKTHERKGKLTWGEVTNAEVTFGQGNWIVYKGPDGDTESFALTGAADRQAVVRKARARIGEYLERKRRRKNSRAARRVQANGPAVNKRKAKRVSKDRNRSSSRG